MRDGPFALLDTPGLLPEQTGQRVVLENQSGVSLDMETLLSPTTVYEQTYVSGQSGNTGAWIDVSECQETAIYAVAAEWVSVTFETSPDGSTLFGSARVVDSGGTEGVSDTLSGTDSAYYRVLGYHRYLRVKTTAAGALFDAWVAGVG